MFWGPEKNSFFSPVDRYQSPILLGICHSLCLGQIFDLGLMISGSEAVVLFLASGLEDHEQEFNHHRRDPLPLSIVTVCSSFLVQDILGDFPAGNCDRTGQAPYLCRAVSFSVTNL